MTLLIQDEVDEAAGEMIEDRGEVGEVDGVAMTTDEVDGVVGVAMMTEGVD